MQLAVTLFIAVAVVYAAFDDDDALSDRPRQASTLFLKRFL